MIPAFTPKSDADTIQALLEEARCLTVRIRNLEAMVAETAEYVRDPNRPDPRDDVFPLHPNNRLHYRAYRVDL